MASGRPSIGASFHERIERVLEDRPELGYSTTAELLRDLLRQWLQENETRTAARPTPVEAADAPA